MDGCYEACGGEYTIAQREWCNPNLMDGQPHTSDGDNWSAEERSGRSMRISSRLLFRGVLGGALGLL